MRLARFPVKRQGRGLVQLSKLFSKQEAHMTQVADDLVAAIEVLDERGWCQKAMHNPRGQVCMVGAVRVATTGTVSGTLGFPASHRFHEAREALSDWLQSPPTVWNDKRGRTVSEVREALLGAARRV